MENVSILPAKPGSISEESKTALREVGVIVIEHENPSELRLISPNTEVPASAMLACAMEAMNGPLGDNNVRSAFTKALGAEIIKARRAT